MAFAAFQKNMMAVLYTIVASIAPRDIFISYLGRIRAHTNIGYARAAFAEFYTGGTLFLTGVASTWAVGLGLRVDWDTSRGYGLGFRLRLFFGLRLYVAGRTAFASVRCAPPSELAMCCARHAAVACVVRLPARSDRSTIALPCPTVAVVDAYCDALPQVPLIVLCESTIA